MSEGGSDPQTWQGWQDDASISNCGICKTTFSLLKRKHHCRKCGMIICNDCSKNMYDREFPLPFGAPAATPGKQRVCDKCNNTLISSPPNSAP